MFASNESKASDIRGEHWNMIYVNDHGRYGECLGVCLLDYLNVTLKHSRERTCKQLQTVLC